MPPDAVAGDRDPSPHAEILRDGGIARHLGGNAKPYSALTGRYHEALAKMLFDTQIYLKLPSSTRLGREFTVYIDPMGAPGQTNARNYGSDYYVVISPGPGAG